MTKGNALVATASGENFYTTLATYSSMLIETARESVDTPSVEGDQTKTVLTNEASALVASLKGSDAMKTDLLAYNDSVLAYAAANNKDASQVNSSLIKVTDDLKSAFSVNNDSLFTTSLTDYKTNTLASIDRFNATDYAGSYTMEQQAEKNLISLFSALSNK